MRVGIVQRAQINTYLPPRQTKNISTVSFGIRIGSVLDDMRVILKKAADKGVGSKGKDQWEPVMSDVSNEEILKRIKDFKEGRRPMIDGPGTTPWDDIPGYPDDPLR